MNLTTNIFNNTSFDPSVMPKLYLVNKRWGAHISAHITESKNSYGVVIKIGNKKPKETPFKKSDLDSKERCISLFNRKVSELNDIITLSQMSVFTPSVKKEV